MERVVTKARYSKALRSAFFVILWCASVLVAAAFLRSLQATDRDHELDRRRHEAREWMVFCARVDAPLQMTCVESVINHELALEPR